MLKMNFANITEAQRFIQRREYENGERFVTVKSKKNFGESELPKKFSNKRFFWNNDIPHIKMGRKVFACAHGKARKKSKNLNTKKSMEDHTYRREQRGRALLGSTKLGCPAKMVIEEMIQFPDYKIANVTKNLKDKTAISIARDRDVGRDIRIEKIIRVSFHGRHEGHLTGNITGLPQRIDSRVAKAVQDMATEGVTGPGEVRRHLARNAKDIVEGFDPGPGNLRYFPSNRTISQHLCRQRKRNQGPGDQQETMDYLREWKENHTEDLVFFRPKGVTEEGHVQKLLLVVQTAWQKRLLARYGNAMSLLDATYKTTVFKLPLYFVAVKTNVDYQVVGAFYVENETLDSIEEGLRFLKDNNPGWSPSYFMTDFDEQEIAAIENIFPECRTLLCEFHREQSWERWVRTGSNQVQNQARALKAMRSLANAETEEEFEASYSDICSSSCFTGKLQRYLERTWLPVKEKWVRAYRTGRQVAVGTTNGLERQHRQFKSNYLYSKPSNPLLTAVKALLERYNPDRQISYQSENLKCSSQMRNMTGVIPKFLQNRPKEVVRHCLKRMESAVDITLSMMEPFNSTKTIVNSSTTRKRYTVCLGDDQEFPSCTCSDFIANILPCKHMFAVMRQEDGTIQWGRLSSLMRESPFLVLDLQSDSVIESHATDQPSVSTATEPVTSSGEPCTESVQSSAVPPTEPVQPSAVPPTEPVQSSAVPPTEPVQSSAVPPTEPVQSSAVPPTEPEQSSVGPFTEQLATADSALPRKTRETLKLLTDLTYDLHPSELSSMYSQLNDILRLHCSSTTSRLSLKRRKARPQMKRHGQKAAMYKRQCPQVIELSDEDHVTTVVDGNFDIGTDCQTGESVTVFEDTDQPSVITATESVQSRAVPPTEPVQSSAVPPTESVQSSAVPPTEPVRSSVVPPTEPVQSSAVPPTEPVHSSVVPPTEPVQSSAGPSTEQSATAVLKNIWSSRPSEDSVGRIGPYLLTHSSFHFLRGTLSDEVIDACLFLLTKDTDTLHINCVVATSIFEGLGSAHGLLQNENIYMYSNCICAVNEGGGHWVLVVILPRERSLIYLNPLGEIHSNESKLLQRWYRFLKDRFDAGIDQERPKPWTVKRIPHSKQPDGTSCGVFVIKFAENFLSNRGLMLRWQKSDIASERRNIALWLINAVKDASNVTVKGDNAQSADVVPCDKRAAKRKQGDPRDQDEPSRSRKRKDERKSSIFKYEKQKKSTRKYCVCRKKNDGRQYWQCDSCDGWFHPTCMGLDEKDVPDVYICPQCERNSAEKEACPTMDDVVAELREEMEVDRADPDDETLVGGLEGQGDEAIAMYFKNPVVQFYYDVQKSKGKRYSFRHSGWGTFILLPNHELDDFYCFRNRTNVEELLVLDPPLQFFFNSYDGPIEIMYHSKSVVQLHPSFVTEKFKEWLQNIKDKLV